MLLGQAYGWEPHAVAWAVPLCWWGAGGQLCWTLNNLGGCGYKCGAGWLDCLLGRASVFFGKASHGIVGCLLQDTGPLLPAGSGCAVWCVLGLRMFGSVCERLRGRVCVCVGVCTCVRASFFPHAVAALPARVDVAQTSHGGSLLSPWHAAKFSCFWSVRLPSCRLLCSVLFPPSVYGTC